MNNQMYIAEYDIYLINNMRDRDVYLKHMIEKRPTLKAFEDLLIKITNEIDVVQDSIKTYTAIEVCHKTMLEMAEHFSKGDSYE